MHLVKFPETSELISVIGLINLRKERAQQSTRGRGAGEGEPRATAALVNFIGEIHLRFPCRFLSLLICLIMINFHSYVHLLHSYSLP